MNPTPDLDRKPTRAFHPRAISDVSRRDDMYPRRIRIALYSHDAMGLGHMRRNLLIAKTLASNLSTKLLLICGISEADAFAPPSSSARLMLPPLGKDANGDYKSRCPGTSLEELMTLRAKRIRAALEIFDPDILIVDKVPRGALGELDDTLKYLKLQGRSRLVLGLRDVLDDPETVKREWQTWENEEAIRKYYDAVWIYGDPNIYDPAREYGFSPDIFTKVRYAGYLAQPAPSRPLRSQASEAFHLPDGKIVLCTVGGGEDGAHLAEAFAQADLPPRTSGIILTGPFMPLESRERLRHYAATRPRMHLLEFVNEPEWLLGRAERVVAMGGYNTVCDILSFGKPALIVPRVSPRLEQMIRAERLCSLGFIDVVHPCEVTPQIVSGWLSRERRSLSNTNRVDLDGLSRVPRLIEELLILSHHHSER